MCQGPEAVANKIPLLVVSSGPSYIRPGALNRTWALARTWSKGTEEAVFVTSCHPHCQGGMQSDRGYAGLEEPGVGNKCVLRGQNPIWIGPKARYTSPAPLYKTWCP